MARQATGSAAALYVARAPPSPAAAPRGPTSRSTLRQLYRSRYSVYTSTPRARYPGLVYTRALAARARADARAVVVARARLAARQTRARPQGFITVKLVFIFTYVYYRYDYSVNFDCKVHGL
jgi:hypothetical protein